MMKAAPPVFLLTTDYLFLQCEVETEIACDADGLAVDDGLVEPPAACGFDGGLLQLLRPLGTDDGLDLALLVDDEEDRDAARDARRACQRGVGRGNTRPGLAHKRADGHRSVVGPPRGRGGAWLRRRRLGGARGGGRGRCGLGR